MFSCVSKGYLWIMLILSSVSKVLPKRFNVFGNSLIILGDMINLCLSSSILVVQHFWFIRSFLNPHYHIPLFYKLWSDCLTERSEPGAEWKRRVTSLYQQSRSLIFYAVGFFYSCKSQHHRRSDSPTAVQDRYVAVTTNPNWTRTRVR